MTLEEIEERRDETLQFLLKSDCPHQVEELAHTFNYWTMRKKEVQNDRATD